MNSNIVDSLITIGSMIIGIAALSVLLSPKSTTVAAIQATASGFSNALGTAMTPVTGASQMLDTSYPDGAGFSLNLPHL